MANRPDHAEFRCWSCQRTIKTGVFVWISETPLPICPDCWGKLSIDQRIRIATLAQDRDAGGVARAIGSVCQAIRERLDSPGGLADSIERGRN
jgi:hypothetical protein